MEQLNYIESVLSVLGKKLLENIRKNKTYATKQTDITKHTVLLRNK